MPRVLADGRTKFTILTVAPADPSKPTATELNAGIDLSCKVLVDDFAWTAADSDKVNEGALCDTSNANSLGRDNWNTAFTLFRYYLTAGGVDPDADAGFVAVKTKGATLYGYARKSDVLATTAWSASDVIQLGAEFTVDNLQDPGAGGWLKYKVPCEAQRAWPFITVGPAPTGWAATTAYSVNDQVSLTGGAVLKCTTAGTSGSTEPAAPASVGGTVTDGTVTWQRVS